MSYQVAIIGGGPGGYVTAIRLQQLGHQVVVIEKERLGGVCLNWGCIPTKALVKVADLFAEIREAEQFGIHVESPTLDYQKVYTRKNEVVERLVSGVEFLFKKRKIDVVQEAVDAISLIDGMYHIHTVGGTDLEAEYVIIATGTVPKPLPFMPFDGVDILSSTDVLKLQTLPERMAVVGGGVIGCEFASIFSQMGVHVEIIEFLPRILATEDEEISRRMSMAFKKSGVSLQTNAGVTGYARTPEGIRLELSNGREVLTDKVLVSVGREPVFGIETDGFELKQERGFIVIDEVMETSAPKVFAIGDITGKMLLAHVASKQGLVVAEAIHNRFLGEEHPTEPICYTNIARCTFTNPEIGSVGLTEKEAIERHGEIEVGKFQFSANGKALGMGATFGFVKTIVERRSGLLVGMHIIGPLASELIAQGGILLGRKCTNHDIGEIVFAHPTLSEAVAESVEDTLHLAIHQI